MALLRVYFDESGIHRNSKIVAIGGLMGTKETWSLLEEKWTDALNVFADVGLTYFHSTECEAGKGEFEHIPIELRFALANRLARIIGSHGLLPVWSAVVIDDWGKTVKDQDFLKAFPKPLHLCFRYCAMRLFEGSARISEGSSIAVVYAEQPEYQCDFAEVWEAYKRNKTRANLSSFTTASYKDCVPLQAADLTAYEMYREWIATVYGEPPPPLTYTIRKPLHYLREANLRLDFGGCYDAHALEEAQKRFKDTGEI